MKIYAVSILILILSLISKVRSQDRLQIDVDSDIPSDGTWEFHDCPGGYADLSTDFDCEDYGLGGINIPPDDLNGEKGFWTKCEYTCIIKYHTQPGDISFKAKIYQKNLQTEISLDGQTWSFIPGNGWVEVSEALGSGTSEIRLRFDHMDEDLFTILDKIVINGDFDDNPDPVPSTTDAEISSTTLESESTETTTDGEISTTIGESESTETTTEGEDLSSSTDPGSTTNDDDTSSDSTPPISSTTDDYDSSSTVSNDPTDLTTESSASSEIPISSSTDDDSSSTPFSTDHPSESTESEATTQETTTDSTTTTDEDLVSSTTTMSTSSTNSGSSAPPITVTTTKDPGSGNPSTPSTSPPNPCLNPPCTSSTIPTTTKRSSGSGFPGSLWGAFIFSVLGLSLFALLFVCCIRCICVPNGILSRRRRKKDDMEEIISETDSSSTTKGYQGQTGRVLYTYMDRYPQLSKSPIVEPVPYTKPTLVSPSSSFSSTSHPFSSRAIYRENTPYKNFQNGARQNHIYSVPSPLTNPAFGFPTNRQVPGSSNDSNTNSLTKALPRRPHNEQNNNRETWMVP